MSKLSAVAKFKEAMAQIGAVHLGGGELLCESDEKARLADSVLDHLAEDAVAELEARIVELEGLLEKQVEYAERLIDKGDVRQPISVMVFFNESTNPAALLFKRTEELDAAKARIRELTEWRPMDDPTLPDGDVEIMCYSESWGPQLSIVRWGCDGEQTGWFDINGELISPECWLPLPEVPR